jgi:isoleucyl-tRNA synthetase
MYRNIDLKEKASDFEKRVRYYWETNNISEKSITNREGADKFIFFEGPPTANGKPGIHHMISRAIKDSVCRYKTMKGYQVKRKAGWDTHGLPVEIEVEKKLNLKNKKEVENYGIEKFNKECKESVFSYEKEWREMTKTMAYWIDLDNPYITLDNNYIESVWWILKQFYDKNMIYKGHKIVPYCPGCGTPLSSHEVAQGYQDVEDPSVFVKFKSIDMDNTYFLAWTTTPWTLISNVALVVHPNEKYVKVKHNEEFLILAKDRLNVLDGEFEITKECLGIDLQFQKYEQLFKYITPEESAFYIACGDYVTMSDGTGVVHTAPAFGQDDYTIGRKYNLPFIQPVDDAGKFTEEIADYQGLFVKEADKAIIRNLKDRNLLYKRAQIIHSYPFCWRCKSPLIYYARSTWYIKTSEFKNNMIFNNNQVNWYPNFVGEKRFGEWLENNVDWALSRDRFWGTPLNIWKCEECGELESIGSIKELITKGKTIDGKPVPENIELHRPYVDNIVIKCPKCQKNMSRTPEVIDCWFDSGSMPFAQWHYPFENKDIFDTDLFPADFICEGIDQTRGWFYTLLAISTFIKGQSPYKNVLVNDLILDKNGQKMSKTRGNSVNPMELMDKYGADAIRWYLLHVSPPWTPTKFDIKGVEEISSKFIGTLKNVYSFFITYAEIDKFNAKEHLSEHTKSSELDKWMYSRLHTLIAQVTDFNEKYDFTKSLRVIQRFVIDEVSNWYVRRSRRRYWAMSLTNDKKEAYLTLYEVLITLSKLIAPFAPFIAEEIYTGISFDESVHLNDYPVSDSSQIDVALETEMQTIIDLITMGRAARNQAQIKVRQTLQSLYVPERHQNVVRRMEDLIKEEINVKEILLLPDNNSLVEWQAKVNFKTVGPKYGKDVKLIGDFLSNLKIQNVINSLKESKKYSFEINNSNYELTDEDIFISILPKAGYAFENCNSEFVVLNTQLSETLIKEGHARELVNKIQFTRKENNFDIMDRVRVSFYGSQAIKDVFAEFKDYICAETLTNEIIACDKVNDEMKQWDINGIDISLKVEKL